MSQRTLSEKRSFLTIHLASLSHSLVFLYSKISKRRRREKGENEPPVDADSVFGHLVLARLQIVDHLCGM